MMHHNKFNIDLIVDILRERKTLKRVYFERNEEEKKIIARITNTNEIESKLKGKKVFAFDTKKHYTIETVHKQWHKGYYVVLALVDDNRSHKIVFWENINSQDESIIDFIYEGRKILHFM